jgi:YD repeat-containing protein
VRDGEGRLGTVRDGQGRSGTVRDGQGRLGTVRDGQGLWCHDDGRSVTMGHDDLKMVTGR